MDPFIAIYDYALILFCTYSDTHMQNGQPIFGHLWFKKL